MGKSHAPAALTPGKRPGNHCTRGWVGPEAGLNRCGISRPQRDSIPRSRRTNVFLQTVSTAAHCQRVPTQHTATGYQNKPVPHYANTQETKRSIRNRPKYDVDLWCKSMPGAVRSKALISNRFISGVAGANPAEIISCVCCVDQSNTAVLLGVCVCV